MMFKIALVPQMRIYADLQPDLSYPDAVIQFVEITDRLLQQIYEVRNDLYSRHAPNWKIAILIDVDYLLNEQPRITPVLLEAVQDNIGVCIHHEEDMEFYIVDALHDRNRGVTAVILRK